MAVALALLVGCEPLGVLVSAVKDEGTVYECTTHYGNTVELCYLDDATDQLGELLGGTCDEPTRRWPRVTNMFGLGCTYACPAPRRGCNAHNGCYCP